MSGGRRRRRAAALAHGIRRALRKRYELVEIETLDLVSKYTPDRLADAPGKVVSRHWFRFAAKQAHIGANEWYHGRLVPEHYRRGTVAPILVYMIRIIS